MLPRIGPQRIRGTIPPLTNTPSWSGAQFKQSTGTTLPFFTFYLYKRNDIRTNILTDVTIEQVLYLIAECVRRRV